MIRGRKNPDYSLLGDQLVSNQVLEKIRDDLVGMKKHDDALKVFERHGIRAYSQALALLGYKVKWSSLDPDNAEILRV